LNYFKNFSKVQYYVSDGRLAEQTQELPILLAWLQAFQVHIASMTEEQKT
jgi:hypothetical protein